MIKPSHVKCKMFSMQEYKRRAFFIRILQTKTSIWHMIKKYENP